MANEELDMLEKRIDEYALELEQRSKRIDSIEQDIVTTLGSTVERLRLVVSNSSDLTSIRDDLKHTMELRKQEHDSLRNKVQDKKTEFEVSNIQLSQLKERIKSLKAENGDLELARSQEDGPTVWRVLKSAR